MSGTKARDELKQEWRLHFLVKCSEEVREEGAEGGVEGGGGREQNPLAEGMPCARGGTFLLSCHHRRFKADSITSLHRHPNEGHLPPSQADATLPVCMMLLLRLGRWDRKAGEAPYVHPHVLQSPSRGSYTQVSKAPVDCRAPPLLSEQAAAVTARFQAEGAGRTLCQSQEPGAPGPALPPVCWGPWPSHLVAGFPGPVKW